jgi:hypothetical protein
MEQRTLQENQPDAAQLDVKARLSDIASIQDTVPQEPVVERSTDSLETESLTTIIEREAKLRRKEEFAGFAWSMLFLVSMLSIAKVSTSSIAALQRDLALCFGLLGVVGIGVYAQLFRSASRRKRGYMKALSNDQDLTQVGALIHTLKGTNASVRDLAKRALIELLPKLKASDSSKLSDAERGILTKQLNINPRDLGYREVTEMFSPSAFRREVNLRVSILKAYEQVGGSKELSTVDKLARGVSTIQRSSRIPEEIKNAASECLPYLEARASDERASKQLLRASSPEPSGNGELLRAVIGLPEKGEDQLLRGAETGG